MARHNSKNQKSSKAAAKTWALEDNLIDELRLKEIAEKSGADFDRISRLLRELTGQEISKELLQSSWDLMRVLLAEAVELRDRAMIHHIINEIIKRKEPKQQQIKTEGTVDHKVLVLVQDIEEKTLEDLIARRNAITIREGQARPVRAIPDRRGTGKKRSGKTVPAKD